MMQGENNTVIYVAIIGGTFTILGSLLAWFLARKKNNADLTGIRFKNLEQELKNKGTGTETLDKAFLTIDAMGVKLLEANEEKRLLRIKLQQEEALKNEAIGRAKEASEDKDRFFDKIIKLEKDVGALKREAESCNENYMALSKKFDELSARVSHIT